MTRHFEQTKARQAADLDARAIHLHGIAQALFDIALVLGGLHVDEVDDHQSTDVTDTQLPGDFVGRFQVGVGGGGFDITAARAACRVDVDRHQRLGVIDNQAATGGQLHLVGIGRFDLVFDLEAREQRHVFTIKAQLLEGLGRHKPLHVFLSLLKG